jgi:hypothetical protein
MNSPCEVTLLGDSKANRFNLGLIGDSKQLTHAILNNNVLSRYLSWKFLHSNASTVVSMSLGESMEQQLCSKSKCSSPSLESLPLSMSSLITLALIKGHYLICSDFNISLRSMPARLGLSSIDILEARNSA